MEGAEAAADPFARVTFVIQWDGNGETSETSLLSKLVGENTKAVVERSHLNVFLAEQSKTGAVSVL